MDRRQMLAAGGWAVAATGTCGAASAAPFVPAHAAPRQFEVTTSVDLSGHGSDILLWLPVFQNAGSYQKVLETRWDSAGAVAMLRDPTYGANLLHARWQPHQAERKLELVQRVATWDRSPQDAPQTMTAAERQFWTQASPGVPVSGLARTTARRIVQDIAEPRARLRAIYDWVIANTWRDPATAGCGAGDAGAMLREGKMGGKCADINGLMVSLCRATGFPARDVYGVRLADSAQFRSLGRSGNVTGAQHCRAEVYLEDAGWFAVDPADVRKVVLEEKLPVDSAPVRDLADRLFGGWEGNWGAYNTLHDLRLAGAPQQPDYHFLMYPCAMERERTIACLDAAQFQYRITAREIVV